MADFYDPTSDIQTEWETTGGNHYGEIDDGIRNPNEPTLADYVRTKGNGDVDEWGFPTVSGSPVEIGVWLYVETGSNATIQASLQQNGTERASLTVPVNTPQGWVHCVWESPSGDLSTLTIEATMIKSGGGAGTYAYVYAAYLRAGPSLDKQVGASGDDGRRYTGSWGFSVTETGSYVGYYTATQVLNAHLFARWVGVTFGGTVDVSYIECYGVPGGAVGAPELKVYGVDEDNPAAPTSAAEFDADPLTTAAVDWDGSWTENAWNQSPSLNGPLQELADAYSPSNEAVMVQIKNDKGIAADHFNQGYQWDHTGNLYGPKLHVEYTEAGGEFPYSGNIPLAALPSYLSALEKAYDGQLPLSALPSYLSSLHRIYAGDIPLEALPSYLSSLHRLYDGQVAVVVTPSATYSLEALTEYVYSGQIPVGLLCSYLSALEKGYGGQIPLTALPSYASILDRVYAGDLPLEAVPSCLASLEKGYDGQIPLGLLPAYLSSAEKGYSGVVPIEALPGYTSALEKGYEGVLLLGLSPSYVSILDRLYAGQIGIIVVPSCISSLEEALYYAYSGLVSAILVPSYTSSAEKGYNGQVAIAFLLSSPFFFRIGLKVMELESAIYQSVELDSKIRYRVGHT